MMLCRAPLSMTMPSQLLVRRLGLHLGLPQMRATPSPSHSTTTTLQATSQNMLSPSPQSPNTPHRSASRTPSCKRQKEFSTAARMDLLWQRLVPGQHLARLRTTVPHTGCSPMATALPPFMPTGLGQSASSMLSPSLVNLCCKSTRIKNLCERREAGAKTLLSKTVRTSKVKWFGQVCIEVDRARPSEAEVLKTEKPL